MSLSCTVHRGHLRFRRVALSQLQRTSPNWNIAGCLGPLREHVPERRVSKHSSLGTHTVLALGFVNYAYFRIGFSEEPVLRINDLL